MSKYKDKRKDLLPTKVIPLPQRNLLMFKFSNGDILIGNKDDPKYIDWVYEYNGGRKDGWSEEGIDIVESELTSQEEFNYYIKKYPEFRYPIDEFFWMKK